MKLKEDIKSSEEKLSKKVINLLKHSDFHALPIL